MAVWSSLERLLQTLLWNEEFHGVEVVRVGAVRIQGQRALKLPLRFAPLPLLAKGHGSRGVRLGQRRIEFERLASRVVRQKPRLFGSDSDVVGRSDRVGLGQAGVGKRVIGVRRDGLLKQIDALLQALLCAPVPLLASFQV